MTEKKIKDVVEHLNSEKRKLAGAIAALIENFEEQTGLAVTNVDIYRELSYERDGSTATRRSIFKELEIGVKLQ